METNTELVQLVSTSGLEKSKQSVIADTLGVFFSKANEWNSTIESIVITSPTEVGKMKMAKEGRLTLKNMRLEGEKIVKAKRDELKYKMANDVLEDKLWLKAGQMMEAQYKNLETKLEEKEKYAERWEAEQKEKLKAQRISELLPLGFQYDNGFNLGDMDESMYQSLKKGLEIAKKEKEDAEKKAEEERIEKERKEAAEQEAQRLENIRLKQEAEKAEKALADEKRLIEEERKRVQAEREKEIAIAEAKAQKEREESERILLAERKLAAEKLEIEKANARKLAAEIEAKKQAEQARIAAEEKAKKASELAAKKASSAPDKDKLLKWVNSFNLSEIEVKDETLNATKIDIETKFNSFKRWAITLIDNAINNG